MQNKIHMYRICGNNAQSYIFIVRFAHCAAMHFSIKSRPFVQLIHVMIIR